MRSELSRGDSLELLGRRQLPPPFLLGDHAITLQGRPLLRSLLHTDARVALCTRLDAHMLAGVVWGMGFHGESKHACCPVAAVICYAAHNQGPWTTEQSHCPSMCSAHVRTSTKQTAHIVHTKKRTARAAVRTRLRLSLSLLAKLLLRLPELRPALGGLRSAMTTHGS